MRFDDKFARALERKYQDKFISFNRISLIKNLNFCFWFYHKGNEFLFKYEYNSTYNNDCFIVTGKLYLYCNGNHLDIGLARKPWSLVDPNLLTKKYDFNWSHPKIILAKRCMEKDVRQSKKELDKSAQDVNRVWKVSKASI